MQRILLTGATGFLGRHTLPVLEARYGAENVSAVSSRDYDLQDPKRVERMFKDVRPDVVVHYAAYSGGIGANVAFPADFYYRNTVLTALVFEAAAKNSAKKIIYPMGGCSYPATASSPIKEEQMWLGYPQAESAAYSTAKMLGIVAARSYRVQYGLNTTVIVPGNMYGEYDNFHPEHSHVIPATIRRYHEAKISGSAEVEMWGSGRPIRDFVYAGDVAATIPFFIEEFDEVGPINVSTGKGISIREMAILIAELTGYQGKTRWDVDKPDGQATKIFAVDQLHKLGLECATSLADGLRRTVQWFQANYQNRTNGLRI